MGKQKKKVALLINSTQLYINNYLLAFTLNSHFYSHWHGKTTMGECNINDSFVRKTPPRMEERIF